MSRPLMPIYFSQEDEIRKSKSPFIEGAKETAKRISKSRGFYLFKNVALLIILLFVIIVCIINLVNYAKVNSDYINSREEYEYKAGLYLPYKANTSVNSGAPATGKIIWNDNVYQPASTNLFVSLTTTSSVDSRQYITSLRTGDIFVIRSPFQLESMQSWVVTGDVTLDSLTSPTYATIPVKTIGTGEFFNISNDADVFMVIFNKLTNPSSVPRSVSESMLIFSIVANSFVLLCSLGYSVIVIRDIIRGYNADDPGRIRKLVNQTIEGAKVRADQAVQDVITKTQIDPDDIDGSKAYLLSTLKFQIENNLDKYINTMVNNI